MISFWITLLSRLGLGSSHASLEHAISPFRIIENIPGRPSSTHYRASVRRSSTANWTAAYVFETICPNATQGDGYFAHLNSWTASWLSLELTSPVEVLVQRIGSSIKSARIHPQSSGAQVVSIGSEGAVISIASPARFSVDFDGGLDETDTGPAYQGPPMHTMSVFANPFEVLPDSSDPAVHFVEAGAVIPTELPVNTTLLFGPGVHRVARSSDGWRYFTPPEAVRVYIPSNAVLHAAIYSGDAWGNRKNVTLEGYGVISGEDLERCLSPPCDSNTSPQGITLRGVTEAIVRGLTFVDFPNHHIMLSATSCERSLLSNVKVLGWRANGDGVHVFGSWLVEKLFLRTQDDSMYTSTGHKPNCDPSLFRQVTTWNDANGASFLITGNSTGNSTDLIDSDVIYARASWPWWSGGRVFSHRNDMNAVENVRVMNVRVEDPLPSLNAFQIDSISGSVRNILFRDISIAAASAVSKCTSTDGCNCIPACSEGGHLPHGIPNIIGQNGKGFGIQGVAFENVRIGGMSLSEIAQTRGWFNVSHEAVEDVTIDGKPFPTPAEFTLKDIIL